MRYGTHGDISREEMEARRMQAVKLFAIAHTTASAVARQLGVSRTSGSRWRRAFEAGASLRARRATGRPSRLSADQIAAVIARWHEGPGLATAKGEPRRWTTALFADAIWERTGVYYDADHVGRIMHRLGLVAVRARRGVRAAG